MGSVKPRGLRPPCPFYGFIPDGNYLMDIGKSNCGLLTPMLIGCKMEKEGLNPDFSICRIHELGDAEFRRLLRDYVVFPGELQPENGGLTGVPFEIWADMMKDQHPES